MDVVLVVGSIALSSYVPRHLTSSNSSTQRPPSSPLPSKREQKRQHHQHAVPLSVKVSTGLSFLLLTLSILEALPSSFMMFLNLSSLPLAYQSLFMIVVLLSFFVFPFVAGAQQQQLVLENLCQRRQRRRSTDSFEGGTRNTSRFRSCVLQALVCLFRCALRVIYCVTYIPARTLLFRRIKEKGPILAVSSSSDSLGSGSDADNNGKARSTGTRLTRLPQTLIGGMFGVLAVFGLLRIIGPWVVLTADEKKTPLLTIAVSWLTAIGLLLSACINGFGSVSMPHSCLAGFYLEPISAEAIERAKQDIEKAEKSLEDRKSQMASSFGLSVQAGISVAGSSKRQSFSEMGEEFTLRRKSLQTEVLFLEGLVAEMKDEVLEMVEMKDMYHEARTPFGRFKLWVGVVFSIILLVRLFSAALFLWKHDHGDALTSEANEPKQGSDPITMILLWLLGHNYVTQQDYNTLSQFISVVLTAVLSFSQVRTFWRIVDAVNRRLHLMCRKVPCIPPCSKGGTPSPSICQTTSSAGVHEHLLACLMGCYFLSCIVLTKLMLPSDYRAAFTDALGGGEGGSEMFRIRSYAVNLAFLFSALLTVFILGILLGIQRQNTVRHLSVWKTASMDSSLDP